MKMKLPKIPEKLRGKVSFRDIAIGALAVLTLELPLHVSELYLHRRAMSQLRHKTEVRMGGMDCIEGLMHNHFYSEYPAGDYLHGVTVRTPDGKTFITSHEAMYLAFMGRQAIMYRNKPIEESPTLEKLAAKGALLRQRLTQQFESDTSGIVPHCYANQ